MDNEHEQKSDCYEIEIPLHLFQCHSSENFNIQSLCRICLSSEHKQSFPLISDVENNMLQEMYTSFTSIYVHPDDSLPSLICEECRNQVLLCYEFRDRCIKSDCILKSLLKMNLEAKHIVLDDKDQGLPVAFPLDEIPVNELSIVKKEDITEDVQYLGDLSGSDNETLCIVQSSEVVEDLKLPETDAASTKASTKKLKSRICSFCNKRFRNSKAVKAHVKRTHGAATLPNSCTQCKESYHSAHDLTLHLPVHGPGPTWTCVHCGKGFQGRSMFRRHIKRHMLTKQYSCETCGKSFAELYALRRHIRVHTGERVEKKYACMLCNKRYNDKKVLSAHLAHHDNMRPYVCTQCGKSFPSERCLTSHHLVHSDIKPHQCHYCDKRFRHESTRNTHHRTHTGERPYVCAVCGKRFIQNSNLNLHMRTHTGERPYSCVTCGMSFSSSSTLKSHHRTHTGDKPYSCEHCGKKFARADLTTHLRQHTGERPFPCAVCPRRFITAARLREHFRLHTGEKAFECAYCSQKFATKSQLAKHIKSHKNQKKREFVYLRDRHCIEFEQPLESVKDNVDIRNVAVIDVDPDNKEVVVESTPDDVSGEIILSDEITDTQCIETGTVCLTSGVNEIPYAPESLVTMNALEGTTVKLYQLDQSLLQIHSSGCQVTISKITSKMTANF